LDLHGHKVTPVNQLFVNSLDYLNDHWDTPIAGSGDAILLLDIPRGTLKTRIARGHALAHKNPGEVRNRIEFTGYHLVHNLLQDRLARYGFPTETADQTMYDVVTSYTERVREAVLAGRRVDMILRFQKHSGDAAFSYHEYDDGRVEPFTGDAALIVPIGTMVVRMAVQIYMRSKDPKLDFSL
jgi:hypothetical protein